MCFRFCLEYIGFYCFVLFWVFSMGRGRGEGKVVKEREKVERRMGGREGSRKGEKGNVWVFI